MEGPRCLQNEMFLFSTDNNILILIFRIPDSIYFQMSLIICNCGLLKKIAADMREKKKRHGKKLTYIKQKMVYKKLKSSNSTSDMRHILKHPPMLL